MGEVLDKRGAAEVLILALLEARPRHGYELAQLIEQRSGGAVEFHAASLYPLLYRLERRGLLAARWVERPTQRRRRFYRLTPAGRKALAAERLGWSRYLGAMQAMLQPEGGE
ncbi:MAG: PadR family transcriptional regulator [Terriglobales bacterium]